MAQRELLELTIAHPLIDAGSWIVLPGPRCEDLLVQRRMRFFFADGRLSIWGEDRRRVWKSAYLSEMEAGRSGEREPLRFFLLCSNPDFVRASEVPRYVPNRELLRFSMVNKAGEMRRAGPTIQTIPFDKDQQKLAAASHARFFGSPLARTPLGLLELPVREGQETQRKQLIIEARRAYWIYEFYPRPEGVLLLQGSDTLFERLPEEEGSAAFISLKPLPVSQKPEGLRLSLTRDDAPPKLLMQNLPPPNFNRVEWDDNLNAYKVMVKINLGFRVALHNGRSVIDGPVVRPEFVVNPALKVSAVQAKPEESPGMSPNSIRCKIPS